MNRFAALASSKSSAIDATLEGNESQVMLSLTGSYGSRTEVQLVSGLCGDRVECHFVALYCLPYRALRWTQARAAGLDVDEGNAFHRAI